MSLDLKTTFKSIALAGLLSAAPIASNADDNTATQNQAHFQTVATTNVNTASQPTPAQLARRAMAYSRENDAVGIFINIAPDTQFTPERLGALIVNKFKDDGIQAAYIAHRETEGTSSVSFFIRGSAYTGYGIDKIEEGYNDAAGLIRARRAQENDILAFNN
jgi:ABC-type sulfate transport system permease component